MTKKLRLYRLRSKAPRYRRRNDSKGVLMMKYGFTVCLLASGCLENKLDVGSDYDPSAPGDGKASAIAAGYWHTCATTGTGVKCWGANEHGQLGFGGDFNWPKSSSVAVPVTGAKTGFIAVASGGDHSCGRTETGGVACWGEGSQAPDSIAPINTMMATLVPELGSGVGSVAVGYDHACAIAYEGAAMCWGNGYFGQLGNGASKVMSWVPVPVEGLNSGVTAIAAGGEHSCAVVEGGKVRCWGRNNAGQLGDGADADSSVPVEVIGLDDQVLSIAAGLRHTCAITLGRGLKCWGLGTDGQLGDGGMPGKSAVGVVDVVGLGSGVSSIAMGVSHSCAVTDAGRLVCWGSNDGGQLGNGSYTWESVPIDVGLSSGVKAVTAGERHTCALMTDGRVRCLGGNSSGELGNGTKTQSSIPVDVLGL